MLGPPKAGFILCAVMALATPAIAPADPATCLPPGTDVAHPKPADFSASDIAGYEKSLKDPEIAGFRQSIDAYLAGNADDITAKTLAPFSKDVLRDTFALAAVNRGMFGGFDLTIVFQHHEQNMMQAWIYQLGDTSTWQIRSLTATPCSEAEQHWWSIRYGQIDALGGA